MSIGYACIHIGSENTKMSSIRLKNASEDNLRRIISKNLDALESIINYNIHNEIKLFRISSDIIPLGSHPLNTIKWWVEYENRLASIGNLIKKANIRVSMHPGQYTVLNSINSDVVGRAIKDLEYHCRFLHSLGCDQSCKIVLHIGGIYSDKQASMERFISNYKRLNIHVKNRLVIENDDKSYSIEDVLMIFQRTGIPVVFDNLHHSLNKSSESLSVYDWIDKCKKTWTSKDGKQKIHYSQQNINGVRGAHSNTIKSYDFLRFYNGLHSKDIDIMLEVKDKNLSAKKCILLTDEKLKIQELENEWAKYKYFVLSRSAQTYNAIRNLLKDKTNPSAMSFYKLLENAQLCDEDVGAEINAAQHVWGYVKKDASERDKKRFNKLINEYRIGSRSLNAVKKLLFKLAKEQSIGYLLDSLYFYI